MDGSVDRPTNACWNVAMFASAILLLHHIVQADLYDLYKFIYLFIQCQLLKTGILFEAVPQFIPILYAEIWSRILSRKQPLPALADFDMT